MPRRRSTGSRRRVNARLTSGERRCHRAPRRGRPARGAGGRRAARRGGGRPPRRRRGRRRRATRRRRRRSPALPRVAIATSSSQRPTDALRAVRRKRRAAPAARPMPRSPPTRLSSSGPRAEAVSMSTCSVGWSARHRGARRCARARVGGRDPVRGAGSGARRCRRVTCLGARRRAASPRRRGGRAPAGGRGRRRGRHRDRGRARAAGRRGGGGAAPAGRGRRRRSGRRSRRENDAERGDRDELAARVTRLEARRESLGRVNPLAKEEYEAEKERLEELSTQRADLEASLTELEELRDELDETVNRRFDETFAAVAANFEEVAATLFPGGEGRLRLVEPEEGEEARGGRRGRAPPRGEEDHAPVAALRRREGARRDLVPVRALPREAVSVLPPRRGRGGARRHEHRALRRAPAPLRRPGAVRRDHAPEADDGGGGRPLRRDDGRRRRLADRLAPPAARGARGRPARSAARSGSRRDETASVRATDVADVGTRA